MRKKMAIEFYVYMHCIYRVHSGEPLCQETIECFRCGTFLKSPGWGPVGLFQIHLMGTQFLQWAGRRHLCRHKMSFLVRECICVLAIGGSFNADILPSKRDTAQ